LEGLARRLKRLEANRRAASGGYEIPPYTLLYLKHLENVSREMDGLEPVPLTPEEEALEAEIDRELRDDPTWCEEEVMAMIEEWESNARDTPERRREEQRGH
jgi:hypothetical protein